jgi:hypothetical protein
MVAQEFIQMEWQIIDQPITDIIDICGCEQHGMGRSVQTNGDTRAVDTSGSQSINWRELKAIELVLKSLPQLVNTTIMTRTDNTTAKSYINKQGGTRSRQLSKLATQIWEMCLKRHLQIQAKHIPGVENQQANYASRKFYTKNLWQITP